jgi:hypothetical protein
MAYTVLVWNLEKLGVKFGTSGVAAQLELLRCSLAAAIAQAAQADAIVIQELRYAGRLVLPTLTASVAAARGGTWHFDWLPGAIRDGVVAPGSFNDLDFDAVANSEGYGVIWRDGALATVAGSPLSAGVDATAYAATNDHYITLVTRGQTLAFNTSGVPITFGDPNAALGFPPSTCPDANSVTNTRSGSYSSNDVIASHAHVRRPCAVVLAPATGVTIPLVVYHAPVGQNSSRSDYYGSLIGFASEQLEDASAAYAGDFNVVSTPAQAALYSYSRETLTYDRNTYIQQGSTGPITPSPSVVHYVNHAGNGYLTGGHVFGSGRDYAFIKKNGRDVTTLVFDALESLRAALLAQAGAALNNAVAQATAGYNTTYSGVRVGDVVERFLANQALPEGTDARTACAIIHRELVSDHLPVAIRYRI